MKPLQFASDNYAGICPEAIDYLLQANHGHASPYGEDEWTKKACDMFRELFETDCDVFFVFNGTASNSLALASLCQPFHSIVCHELSHIETDECGAPEFYTNGAKLLLGTGANGKITPASIEAIVKKRSDIHYPKPRAVSLTQATEVGTLYSQQELLSIYMVAKKYGLKLQMDGARFANAVAGLKCTPKEISWQAGIDVICFGGTKNGLAGGEAVIFFNKRLSAEFAYRCKQSGQLASKMRFLAAPWVGMLTTGAWLRNAEHANRCAARLESLLAGLAGVEIMFPCQANSVFVRMPEAVLAGLKDKGWKFYTFIGAGGVRFMCSWDTTEDSILSLVSDIEALS